MRATQYFDEHIDQKTAQWLRIIRGRVRPRPHLSLQIDRAALLVIDMVRYFADPTGRCYLPATEAIVPRIAALIDHWRRMDRPVFFTRHGHTGDDDLGMLGRFFDDFIKDGETDAEIIPALSPISNDTVIKKTTYDAFLGTSLLQTLSEHTISQVVITGVLTHMCCETTARSAFCRGFEVYLPVDALATTTESLHLNALIAMADAVAVPLSVGEIVRL